MKLGKIPDQVIRLAFLFAVAIAALIAVRAYFVPATFGETGHYRSAAIGLNAEQPVRYAGWQACVQCHDDVGAVKASSFHRGVACEVCHGAAADHAEAPDEHKPDILHGREGCVFCHEYLPAWPTGFPQIIEKQHNPMQPCADCHNPHDPSPPQVPGTCAACHAQIASTKALSKHARLACENCHEVAAEHREHPRLSLAKKPVDRETCAQCHAQGRTGLFKAPQLDFATHGGGYLCWQCHYPHSPEAT